ncbi:hypothetical protein PoB_005165400 [Plakobranchus ocellatus]|uniref:C-type lectin domain-containing protein n=1 Tax=Plakobranchus ocellatus TaxID=259542 RepID=A0AAV4C201_9GAST|nr:hypothetical protein PoB_005165400 [Plakobranchus ocellatus]
MSGHPNSRSISSRLRFGLLVAGWVLSSEVIAIHKLSRHYKCPKGWLAEQQPKFCFKIFDKNNEKSTYSAASSTCSENGGALISTDDVEVAAYADKPAVWIHKKDANSACQVYNRGKSVYRPIECSKRRAFICKRDTKEIIFYGRVTTHLGGAFFFWSCDNLKLAKKRYEHVEQEDKFVFGKALDTTDLLYLFEKMDCSSSTIYQYRCLDPSTRQRVMVFGVYVLEPKACQFLWLPTRDKITLSAISGETAHVTLAAITDQNQDVHNVALSWYRNNRFIINDRKPKLRLLHQIDYEGTVYILIDLQFTPTSEEDYGEWMVATGLYPSSTLNFTVKWKGPVQLCPFESDNREFVLPLNESFTFSVCYLASDSISTVMIEKDPQDGKNASSTWGTPFRTKNSKIANYQIRYNLIITNEAVRKEDLGTWIVYMESPGHQLKSLNFSFKLTAADSASAESSHGGFSSMATVVIPIALVIVAFAVLGFLVFRKRGYIDANNCSIQTAESSVASPQERPEPGAETLYVNPVYSNTAGIMDNMGTAGSAVTM